jgi:hypothetical protein
MNGHGESKSEKAIFYYSKLIRPWLSPTSDGLSDLLQILDANQQIYYPKITIFIRSCSHF